jgi:hypothetical protein
MNASPSTTKPSSFLDRAGDVCQKTTIDLGAGLLGVSLVLAAHAETRIFSCTDTKGRRLTSDRPIAECADREQRELYPTGGTKRIIPPELTAVERAEHEARRKAQEEKLARAEEEKRKERLLAARYPNQAAHDRARSEALQQIDAQAATIRQHQATLEQQRRAIDGELEFYQGDATKAPPVLRRQLENNQQQRNAQVQRLEALAQEKARINQRFDEELERLRQLWGDKAPSR